MKPFLYGRDSLFNIRKGVINKPINTIDSSLWNKLKELKIAKKTKRGCRGGRNKQRQIKVQVSTRSEIDSVTNSKHKFPRKVNHQNLAKVPIQNIKEPYTQRTKFACWNARSIKNKTTHVCDLIIAHHLDVLAIAESWQTGDQRDNHAVADILATLPGYAIYSAPRKGRKGGGICIIYRKEFEI